MKKVICILVMMVVVVLLGTGCQNAKDISKDAVYQGNASVGGGANTTNDAGPMCLNEPTKPTEKPSTSQYIYIFDGYDCAIMLDEENPYIDCPVIYQKDNVYVLSNIDKMELPENIDVLYYPDINTDMMGGGPNTDNIVKIGSLTIVCN